MDPVDRSCRMQQVSLACSRTATAYVDPADRTASCHYYGRPGQPGLGIRCVVPDLKSLNHPLILPTCQTPVEL
jgi:hypothetical protein